MFIFYQMFISIIIFFSPIIIFFRIYRNKEDKKRFLEKFSIPSAKRKNKKLIWFHGASVGEILSIIPLIRYYENNNTIGQVLVTSSTLSSAEVFKKLNLKKTTHQYYPIDHFFFTDKFLKYWKPNIAIFVDSEIWPCMFKSVDKKKIPLVLINGRLTNKTFKRWIKIKNFAKSIFNKITVAMPQNYETNSYLKKLKHKNIKMIGNLKFAEDYNFNLEKIENKLKLQLINKKIWVAASTHNKEEIFCAKTHLLLKKKYKNLVTIIIPRHVHRSKEIASKLKDLNLNITFHSYPNKDLNNVDIYIVDTFGETKKFYKISPSVFIGGSIIKRGGQNPLEAARFGSKILHGPNVQNFQDVYKLLSYLKTSFKINSPKQLASSIDFKKKNNSKLKIKNLGTNILKRTIKELDKYIFNDFKKT